MTQSNQLPVEQQNQNQDQIQNQMVQGRCAFLVQTTQQGVSVTPVLVDLEEKVRHFPGLPAIFPNLEYALTQIDELRNLVIQHFEVLEQSKANEQVNPKKQYKLGEDAS